MCRFRCFGDFVCGKCLVRNVRAEHKGGDGIGENICVEEATLNFAHARLAGRSENQREAGPDSSASAPRVPERLEIFRP